MKFFLLLFSLLVATSAAFTQFPNDPVVNFGVATVSQGYDGSAISITLGTDSAAIFPNPSVDGAYNLVWWNATDYPGAWDDDSVEIVRVTARAGDVLTVTRGQEGTIASIKNVPGKTYMMQLASTAKTYQDIGEALSKMDVDTTGLGVLLAQGLSVMLYKDVTGQWKVGSGVRMGTLVTGDFLKAFASDSVATGKLPWERTVAIGDENTEITATGLKITFRMPFAVTLTEVRASLTTASSSGLPEFDIRESGTTILSVNITIDVGEKTSESADTPPTISDASLADDAEITVYVITTGTNATGAKICLLGLQ